MPNAGRINDLHAVLAGYGVVLDSEEIMMADRELLELAAKAAGIARDFNSGDWYRAGGDGHCRPDWNPFDDSGEALQLVADLKMCVAHSSGGVMVGFPRGRGDGSNVEEDHGSDPLAATRRAIVRAAAEIGRTK